MTRKVLVLGDLMLDITTEVQVRGTSPEFDHVLVGKVTGSRTNLGGAGNVAAGIHALGREVASYGMISADGTGEDIVALLLNHNVYGGVERWYGGRSTWKNRIVCPSGHLLRVDREERGHLPTGYWSGPNHIIQAVRASMPGDGGAGPVLVLVDYDKGFFANGAAPAIMAEAAGRDVPVLVDPGRGGDWGRFAGPNTVFKANVAQARALYLRRPERLADPLDGRPFDHHQTYPDSFYEEITEAVASNLFGLRLDFRALVLTFGAGGLALRRYGHKPEVFRAPRVAAVDPCGAGDSVLATLAYFVAGRGLSNEVLADACPLAVDAAALAVQRPGAVAISRRDLFTKEPA